LLSKKRAFPNITMHKSNIGKKLVISLKIAGRIVT
jgi:hypothetical protein